ncbi:hypothetical protein VDGE_03386 [Verticillium dahliae]|uniref:Uncharacterized protein n=1 Tax=Verticillium dahliae TaxID=27337 RepID=A0A444RYC5_VERDA|nr:hypothetical protein VDGE_03386 [Verticillium dahliae]
MSPPSPSKEQQEAEDSKEERNPRTQAPSTSTQKAPVKKRSPTKPPTQHTYVSFPPLAEDSSDEMTDLEEDGLDTSTEETPLLSGGSQGANSAAESLRRHLTDKDTEASMSERAINRPRSSSLAGAFTRIFSPLSRSNSAKSTTGHPKTWAVYNENVDGAEQGQKSNKER